MFVFKAAVVGAGTMGGQIAQTIAAAGIPVLLKDIKQELVDAGLAEARNVTSGQIGKLVEKGKITEEQAAAQIEEVLGRITGTTTYEGFGDVDFVVEAVPERMDIKQAVFAELDACTPGHAILASNTSSLSITEIGEATLRPDKVVGFHYFYPASIMPLIEVIEGDDTSPETIAGRRHLRPGDPQAADHLRRGARASSSTASSTPARREIWRAQEEEGLSIKKIDEGVGAAGVIPMGPFFLVNLLGLDTVLHVAEHLQESYGDRFYVPKGMQQLVADGKLGAKTGGDGFYSPSGEPQPRRRGRARRRAARRDADAEDLRRGLPGARGGRRDAPRHRLRPDGRGRARPAPRPAAAVHEGRRRGARHGARAARERGREVRRALRAADDPAAPRRAGAPGTRSPARASTPIRRPTPSSRPATRRSSSSRRAATSRSPGSPTA